MSKKQPASSHKPKTKQSKSEILITNTQRIESRLLWILLIGACLLYWASIRFGFVLDDIAVIENNRFVQEGFSGIPDLFSTFYWKGYWDSNAGLYRPLSMVMFAVEWGISPNNPSIHHFVNVILYALSIGWLFKLLLKLLPNYSVWVSFSIVVIFMVHPSHTEVVANIKSRDEILCFLFFVLTFLSLIKQRKGNMIDLFRTILLFSACLLSKEAGIMYLPIFGLYFLLLVHEPLGQVFKKLMPLFAIAILWIIVHQLVIYSDPTPPIHYSYHDNSIVLCEGSSRIATGIGILGHYIYEVFVPFNLSYDYSYNQLPCSEFSSVLVISTLFFIGLSGIIVLKTRKRKPEIAFGILFFLLTIALVTNIFSLIGTTYANRLIYAPSLGLIISFVVGIYTISNKYFQNATKITFVLFITLFIISFSLQTITRCQVWESNKTLFTADVKNSPNSARVHFNYGVVLMQEADINDSTNHHFLQLAKKSFLRAIEIDSMDLNSMTNLGVVNFKLKQFNQSIFYTKKALLFNPDDVGLKGNLGDAYFEVKKYDQCITYYNSIFKIAHASKDQIKKYGTALFHLKRYPEAIVVFNSGVHQFPDDTEMSANLGNAYGANSNYKEAAQQFEKIYLKDTSNFQAFQLMKMCQEQANLQSPKK